MTRVVSAAKRGGIYGTYAGFVIAAFAVGATLTPAPSGLGTHVALGLPPCLFLAVTGLPCPACGMTTAFVHVAHGRLLDAFVAQPFGALLALASLAGLAALPVAFLRGVTPRALFDHPRANRIALVLLALFALAWVYKLSVIIVRG